MVENLEYMVDAIIDGIEAQLRMLVVAGVIGERVAVGIRSDLKNQYWQWRDDKKKQTPPTSPMMPEVTPMPPIPSSKMPPAKCDIYDKEMDDKKAGTCDGCKIAGCSQKGTYGGPRAV